jgi:hypothetical protein
MNTDNTAFLLQGKPLGIEEVNVSKILTGQSEEMTDLETGTPLTPQRVNKAMYENLPEPSRFFGHYDFNGVKSINKYEIPFSALAHTLHRKISVPVDSRFINFMLVPYLEYEKPMGEGTTRRFLFDIDRTPRNEEMANMKANGVSKLVFFVYVAVFNDKAPLTEKGIIIAKTRESLNNFNIDYYIGSVAKNYTTHYHAFALKD